MSMKRDFNIKKRVCTAVLAAALLPALLAGTSGCGADRPAEETASADRRTAPTAAAFASAADGESGGAQAPASPDSDGAQAVTDSSRRVRLDVGLLGNSIKPVGVLVADALGYFEAEGVDVAFQKVSSMNDAYLAVASGDLDVYLFSSTAAATFISQGTDTLRVFGGTAAEGSEIMAAKDKGYSIRTAADFRGLTIACQMPETGQMVLKDYLIRQGYTVGEPGSGADVTFVYVADSSTMIEGCVKGAYDLCITNASLGYYADRYGVSVVATVRDFVPNYPCCRQTCNLATYEQEKDALIRFEIAVLRGYAFYREHEAETLDILEAYSGEDRDFLKAQIYGTDDYKPVMRLSIDPDQKACTAFYQALANIGALPGAADIDWHAYVVTDVYASALRQLAAREPDRPLWKELTAYFETHNR